MSKRQRYLLGYSLFWFAAVFLDALIGGLFPLYIMVFLYVEGSIEIYFIATVAAWIKDMIAPGWDWSD